jgi:hypothetical protein
LLEKPRKGTSQTVDFSFFVFVPPEVFLEENRGENLASENSKRVLNLTWIMDLGSIVVGAAQQ